MLIYRLTFSQKISPWINNEYHHNLLQLIGISYEHKDIYILSLSWHGLHLPIAEKILVQLLFLKHL